jgi:hypothetical protein
MANLIALPKINNMASQYDQRRKISFAVVIIIGLAIGFAIKRVGIGLLLGVVLGLLASGMLGGSKEKKVHIAQHLLSS